MRFLFTHLGSLVSKYTWRKKKGVGQIIFKGYQKCPVQTLIYNNAHALKFVKTAQLWEIFYNPAHARLYIKETDAGRTILN
jgi:hypothetical protein